jgi:RHS repeat-associated protein
MNDWAVLDRTDPAPGDPAATRALGERMLSQAQTVDASTGRLRSVAAGTGELQMAGDYAASYSEALQTLPGDLDKLSRAYRGCGTSLTAFATSLEEAKTRAGAALAQGRDADSRYRMAMREIRMLLPPAQQMLVGNGLALHSTAIEAATMGLDAATREQVRAAAGRARNADADLDRARALADQAAALRGGAEERCARGIDDALDDSGLKNKPWYEKALNAVSAPFRSWDAFVDLCQKVALVAGVAAMFISGPIGWGLMAAALVAGGAILANDVSKYGRGQVGLGTLAFDALGLVPGARGVVSVTKLGRHAGALGRTLTRPGAAKILAGALGRQVRNTVTALPHALKTTAGMRGAVKDPRLFARAFKSRFVGRDPIDLVSGEMVLQMTDFELPGLLPLVLQRTYVSSYGVGRWFGPSWSSFLDQRLEVDALGVCFAYTEAVILTYPPLAPGESALPDEGPRLPLYRTTDGAYVVEDPAAGRRMSFAAPPQEPLDGAVGVVLPLAAIEDRNGNRVEFGYDAVDGTLAEIRHSGGYVLDVETAAGLVTAFTLRGSGGRPDTTVVRYGYDERGRLIGVVNSSGLPLRFSYDTENRITSWEDRIGTWYRYAYDGEGRVVRTSGSAHCLDGEIRYDRENRVTVEVNSVGAQTAYQFNEAWQVERVVDPLGSTTRHEWDRYDRKLSETDPLGRTTRYAYDEDANLAEVTRPDGRRARIAYSDLRLPTQLTQPDDAVWQHEYDQRGNLVSVSDPAGAVTRYEYGTRGDLRAVTDPLGHTSRVHTDAAGLPLAVTDPLSATMAIERDDFGRVVTLTDPLGNTTRFAWTVEGKLAARVLPDGATESWRYDGEGSLIEHVDALGQSTRIEQTYFDLPAVRTAPDGSRVAYTYDTELRLTSVTDPRGLVWRYDYDAAGRLVRESDYDGRVLTYAYDAAGQLVERINGAGEPVAFTRDPLGNVIERRTPTAVTTLSYDPVGRLVRAVNADADVEFERDPLGRVLAETINGRTLASFYDAAGRRVRRRTPSGVESRWTFDAAGRPADLTTAGRRLDFEYDAAGREVTRRFGDVATLSQSWDPASRLASQVVTSGGATSRVLKERTYSYRADGYVTSIDDRLTGRREHMLDTVGQVTAVSGPGWSERYAYDPSGNVVEAFWPTGPDDEDGGATGHREFDGSRVRTAGNLRYEYDAQGRVTMRRQKMLSSKARVWHFTWDGEDLLIGVTTPDGDRWRYLYDALGRRVAKHRLADDGTVAERVDFTWDGILLAEQSATSAGRAAQVTAWEWQPGGVRPLLQHGRSAVADAPQEWIDAEFHAIVTDLIGAPEFLVDEAGERSAATSRTLWKGPLPGAACPLGFPGQYEDAESGLNYNVFRHYDPAAACYTSADPIGLAAGHNPRAYVSNPTTWSDPLGLTAHDYERLAGPAVGFAEGLGETALTPGRLQHGTRHLIESGVLPKWSGTNSPEIIRRAFVPILEHPTATFDHTLGGTRVRGFLGDVDGQQVAVFVYKEGQYQGELASSSVPTMNQLKKWGLL